jgi:hypothetical protein
LSRRKLPPALTGSQRQTAKTWSTPGTSTISANFLFDSSGPIRPCNSQKQFYSGPHSFPPGGGEVFNEAEPCNIQVKNPPQKHASKEDRDNGLRHSTNTKSPRGSALATLACDNSVQKSPKGAAGQSTTSVKKQSLPRRLSVQKSPKGAAGLAQQVRKTKSTAKTIRAEVA